jgi:RNA polymerase subunit RPABC4/transcription elongation factor Spt4
MSAVVATTRRGLWSFAPALCFHFDQAMGQLCANCGAGCTSNARFCRYCGSRLSSAPLDPAVAFALSQPVCEFCELRCGALFGHRWKAYGVLRGGRYYFRDEDRVCPRCGRAAVSAAGQTDLMLHEQRRTNFWLAMLYWFRD